MNRRPLKPGCSYSFESGFSLVELLIVISVIGVMAALAIPNIADFSDSARSTVAKRNAQNVGGISESLAGLGVNHVIPESLGGEEATCRLIKNGIVVPEGPMIGTYFGMPGLPDDKIPQVAVYLDVAVSGVAILRLEYNDDAIEDE